MDHLFPVRDRTRSLEVPVFGPEIYDNLGFATYPDRRGWNVYHLGHPSNGSYGGRSSLEAASFAQAWLYFGTISEVTGIPVRGTNFMRVGKAGRLVITTERLHLYLDRWKQKEMEETDEIQRKRGMRRGRQCLDLLLQYTYRSPSLLVPEHPELAVSIEMLLIALFDTFTAIYGKQSWHDASTVSSATEVPSMSFGTNRKVIQHLKAQMVSQGWCRYRLESLDEIPYSDSLYVVSLLGTDDLLTGHSSCSESICVGNQVDDRTYNSTERHVLQECACGFVTANISETIKIIERGQIPLATISVSTDNELLLDVTPYETGMSYIAISHVWSHGLGNPDENALRHCQLQKLQTLLNRCRESPESATVHFWLDTLCLPLRPVHWRKVAMRQMRQCYAEASIVLVLDAHLQRLTTHASAAELLLHIGISDWRFRVWTVQEAFFARKLMFQFLETAVDSEELLYSYVGSISNGGRILKLDHVGALILSQVAPALGFERGERRKGQSKTYSMSTLASSLRGRAISKPEDEPLCAASLLGQDDILGILLDSAKEDRMKTFGGHRMIFHVGYLSSMDLSSPRLAFNGHHLLCGGAVCQY